MKTKTTITKTEEVEIDLPNYVCDRSCHWYKIIDENTVIQVTYADHVSTIGTCRLALALHLKWEECTEQEFYEAFNRVSEKINSLVYPVKPLDEKPYASHITPEFTNLMETFKGNAK